MKLATIEIIEKILPHPNAERIELAVVLGYQCVVQKGIFSIGEKIVFIQPDTCLPESEKWPWALPYKKYVGSRVKAVEFRKEWSEGIIVKLNEVSDLLGTIDTIGTEVSSHIGVIKFIAPDPFEAGAISSILPLFMKETNEDRFENIPELPYGELTDVTLKIDGKSTTFYYDYLKDKFGVCGRSLEFDLNHDNPYSKQANVIKEKFVSFCKEKKLSLALRGELYGSNASKGKNNPHNNRPTGFACYNIFNITKRTYEYKGSELYYIDVCRKLGIEMVPLIEENVIITKELIERYSKGLKRVTVDNFVDIKFEGAVFKFSAGSFKIINKHYDSEK